MMHFTCMRNSKNYNARTPFPQYYRATRKFQLHTSKDSGLWNFFFSISARDKRVLPRLYPLIKWLPAAA